jgi:hypothetical protein
MLYIATAMAFRIVPPIAHLMMMRQAFTLIARANVMLDTPSYTASTHRRPFVFRLIVAFWRARMTHTDS